MTTNSSAANYAAAPLSIVAFVAKPCRQHRMCLTHASIAMAELRRGCAGRAAAWALVTTRLLRVGLRGPTS